MQKNEMINFTIGPVQSNSVVREIGAENVPYFRTAEFSKLMLENEKMMLNLADAPEGARCVFLTGSGTASMEAAVINTLSVEDKALVIDGGSFGHRFTQLLDIHEVPYEAIRLEPGKQITQKALDPYDRKGFTAFLVNIDETSTGILYDIELISSFCERNGLFLIIDAISSFLADEFSMREAGADVMLVGSQKALACPPGVSVLVLSKKALSRVSGSKCRTMYLDLKTALKDMERGQTPFTPAVATLIQLHARMKQIMSEGGAEAEVKKTKKRAEYFREKIRDYPFTILPEACSNAVTTLVTEKNNAPEIFNTLKDDYGIWICPNGGELKDRVFRVGHIGELSLSDYDTLFEALNGLKDRGIL